MASMDINSTWQSNEKPTKSVKLCTFCNNSTNGFDKWLHVAEQDKGPFFPILADIRGEDTVFDNMGRALVCVACFHHLLRQWSSYERRCIPLKKRQYNLVAEEKLSNFQVKREEEIRKEGEFKLKEIKLREQKIKREAQERLEHFRQKEQSIRKEAGRRLLEEEEELEAIKREAERQLKEEQAHEEELKRLLEEEIQLERQKGNYIRKEAERLLREEKFLKSTKPPANVRTEVLIHSPQGRAFDQIDFDHYSDENIAKDTDYDNTDGIMEPRKSRTMEYDPVTGCYVRKVPLDFSDKKVEDIVKEEMIKSERKPKPRSRDQSWKKPEEKESGSTPDTALVDLSLRSSDGDNSLPHYVSGEGIETEYKFTVKEEIKTESKPSGVDKNGEFADEDIKKAGQEMKAKFEDDRMKFERDSSDFVMSETTKRSFERRRRSDEDPDTKKAKDETKQRRVSLDRRLKDMEERRARLFKDSPEDKVDSGEVKITRTVTTETSYSAPASSEDSMLSERMQDTHRRHRNREERIRRRKNAEELISKKTSESEDKPIKSTGVKLELRGSALKKREDTSSKNDSEPNAFSGSNYSYLHEDDTSDISFTVKKPAETKKDDDDIGKFDKKESTFDWKESEQKFSLRTNETKTTSVSLMDEPIMWSQPGRGTDDDISFSVKEPSKKPDGDKVEEERGESRRSLIKETEVKVVESKPVQSLFSSDFGQEESQDIVFSVKETSTSTKSTTEDDSSKSKPKELTLERGTFDEKYSVTSTTNSDLLRWEMDNVDSGKSSEPEPFDNMDGYRDSLRRTNALGRVGSFKKGREELPPAIFHDIESDAPAASLVDIRTESPSLPAPVSKDNTMEAGQAPNLLSKLQDEDHSEERRRRRQEIEEKKRRIAESQKKANVQLRRDVSGSEKTKDGAPDTGSNDNIEDLSEKRRSLLMMWESYAEGEGPGPENIKSQEEGKSQFGYDVMMMEAAQDDPNAVLVDYRTMDVDDEKEETRAPMIDIDEYHKLNDDELKWERAGQFQPGKLKTKFHEVGKDDSSSEPKSTWRGMNNNDISGVSTKVTREEQRFSYKTPVEEDQSYADKTNEVESAPKQLWDKSQGQSTFKSDDEDEEGTSRQPHVDMDEVYHMTEEEARWEKVGHFQPGKINTSIFESRKKADKNGDESSKIQKREKSRYEQIKKIQRTDSKKELLVPKKVSLKSDRTEDVEEEVEEDEKPHVGKIATPSFHASEEDRKVQEREARNRREMEEIQREREEERRRQEREYLDSKITINEFEDDEFDTKVKSKDVGKIDITKFGDFQKKSEPIPDKKPVSKRSTKRIVETRREDKVESVGRTNFFSTEDEGYDIQFQQGDAGGKKPERKTSDKASKRDYGQRDVVVVSQTTREVESAPDYSYEEDEYEIKRRSVGKLNKDWLSQAQEQEAREMERRRKETEMERIRKEQYEIELLKLEENKRRETKGDEISRDEIQLSEKPQSVKKLDSTSMTPFLKGGRPSPEGSGVLSRKKSKDEVRQERKLARKESRSKMETREVLYAEETEDVQESPESFDDRPKVVGKLNTGKYLQMMGEDHSDKERRKKLVEEERMRRELEEMERQREEEERKKEIDRDDTSSSSSSDRPQNVSKLDLAQFSQFQKKETASMKQQPKERTRESKKIEIIERQTVDEVESQPFVPETSEREWLDKERSEALEYEEKRQNVGKLDVNRLMQSRSEEEQERQSRIKELERQRIFREREEMERLKAEKKKGKKSVDLESDTSSEASHEDHKVSSVKSSGSQHEREREEEWTIEEKRKSGVGRLNVDQFMQSMSKEEEEKNRRKLELEKERIRREAEERERLRMEQQMSSENIKVSTVQEVHSAPEQDFYERANKDEREREEEQSVEEKRKSVGRLDVSRFVQSLSNEEEEKRRRKIELEKERIRRENEERELLRLEQERKNRGEPSVTKSKESSTKYFIVHKDSREPRDDREETESRDKEKYTIIDREREEEMSVEEKRKSVGRLDVGKYMQSLNQEEEEKRRRMIELEKERIRREEEEKELLRLEQERAMGGDVSRSTSTVTSKSSFEKTSRTVVQDVESSPYDQPDEGLQQPSRIDKQREEELSVEEKRKSVGRLNVNQFFQSLNEEEEEKRRRLIELEKERIRRENEERELLQKEQERSRRGQVEQVNASVVQEVHSAPPDDFFTNNDKRSSLEREREEATSVEEKRKSVGRLDFNQFIQSLSEEDKEKQMRKIELERERLRREKEEREMEERQYRVRESSSYSEKIQTSSVEVVQSEIPGEYEDGDSSQDKKEVGRLDLERYSQQFTQEARERERRARELEIERLRLEREEMEGRGGSQTVQHESWSSERRETTVIEEKRKYRGDEVDRRSEGQTESIKSEDSSDSDKPVPKKLDLSKFSAFQSGSGGKRATKDDSAVRRREKTEAGRQTRPKSIAGSSFGGVANGEARSGERVYRIIH